MLPRPHFVKVWMNPMPELSRPTVEHEKTFHTTRLELATFTGQGRNVALCEQAVALIEQGPYDDNSDAALELAFAITQHLGVLLRPELSLRALRAAWKNGSCVTDRRLERKWLTFVAELESWRGNRSEGLVLKARALTVAQEIGDEIGEAVCWVNLAADFARAGQFQDTIQLTTAAIDRLLTVASSDLEGVREILYGAYMNRQNSLERLGRLEEARSDLLAAIAIEPTTLCGVWPVYAVTARTALVLLLVRLDRVLEAQLVLRSAEQLYEVQRVTEMSLRVVLAKEALAVSDPHGSGDLERLENVLRSIPQEEGALELRLDTLNTLEQAYRTCGHARKADQYLREIGSWYRSCVEREIASLNVAVPNAIPLKPEEQVREIEQYVATRSALSAAPDHELLDAWGSLVNIALSAISVEDPSGEHGYRVARLAGLLAEALGESPERISAIESGALLHDLGKCAVPKGILACRHPLDEAQREIYESHPAIGAELLERAKLAHKGPILNIARFHHHAFDGNGGNREPRGQMIPLEARIVAVADAFDGLVSGRPRLAAMSSPEALKNIFGRSGRDFDPRVVDALVGVVRQIQRANPDVLDYLSYGADCIGAFATRRSLDKAVKRAIPPDRTPA
jgi:putative nucleotidyltransferase with HDIG domain